MAASDEPVNTATAKVADTTAKAADAELDVETYIKTHGLDERVSKGKIKPLHSQRLTAPHCRPSRA